MKETKLLLRQMFNNKIDYIFCNKTHLVQLLPAVAYRARRVV